MSTSEKSVDELGYEEARDELIDVVRVLEQGGLDLDASLALWERGEKLAKRCEFHLAGARRRIETALAEGDTTQDEASETDGAGTPARGESGAGGNSAD